MPVEQEKAVVDAVVETAAVAVAVTRSERKFQ
jgi:hypothetical protein